MMALLSSSQRLIHRSPEDLTRKQTGEMFSHDCTLWLWSSRMEKSLLVSAYQQRTHDTNLGFISTGNVQTQRKDRL